MENEEDMAYSQIDLAYIPIYSKRAQNLSDSGRVVSFVAWSSHSISRAERACCQSQARQ